MWDWLASIKGETWGAFAGGLLLFLFKVVGPALTKYATEKWRRQDRELDALDGNAREEIVEGENSRLRIELGLAQRDLNAAGEDLRRMANRIEMLERERDSWKRRAEALAREQGLIGGKDVGTNSVRTGGARPARARSAADRSLDHVPTVPPRKPDS